VDAAFNRHVALLLLVRFIESKDALASPGHDLWYKLLLDTLLHNLIRLGASPNLGNIFDA
jgi:hypothetical protein